MLVPDGDELVKDNKGTVGHHDFVLSYYVSKTLSSNDVQASVNHYDCVQPLNNTAGYDIKKNVSDGRLDVILTISSEDIDANNEIYTSNGNGNLAKVGVCVSVSLKNQEVEVIRKEV